MKVFVLISHTESQDAPGESYCEGVFYTKESATAAKEELFKEVKESWLNYKNESSVSIVEEDTISSLEDTWNNIDYFCLTIIEKEVE